jgi:ADP-heptose:LPS heptosyltransferase
LPDTHIVDRYMASTVSLGVVQDDLGLDWYIPKEKEVDIQAVFGFVSGKYISIVIGAAHFTKCLTVEQLVTISNKLHYPVILLGGKEEVAKANRIMESVDSDLVKSACGNFDLLQSSSILRQSGSIITHDTGLMHIAAALKKPQVVVWGNTIPQFGMYPYYGHEGIIWISFEQQGLKCRPCSKLGYPQCPKGHFKCILDHDLNAIAEAALSLMT